MRLNIRDIEQEEWEYEEDRETNLIKILHNYQDPDLDETLLFEHMGLLESKIISFLLYRSSFYTLCNIDLSFNLLYIIFLPVNR